MESLPVEITTQILYTAYTPCLEKYADMPKYINGVLVCSLWRDILYNYKHYITMRNITTAVVTLPWNEQYTCAVSVLKANMRWGCNKLKLGGYDAKTGVILGGANLEKNIKIVVHGSHGSTIEINTQLRTTFKSNTSGKDNTADMHNIVKVLNS